MLFHMQDMMSKGQKIAVSEDLDVSGLFKGRSDVPGTGPLHVSLRLEGHPGFITADGELEIDLELACSRCLEPVKEHAVIPFREQFKPLVNKDSDDEDADDEENDFAEVAGEKLDLKPFLEEALLLHMPFAPLCADDCRGLCQECGQNLNERACGCTREETDPRFAALKDYFKE